MVETAITPESIASSAYLLDQIETRARQIANDIIAQQAAQSQTVSSGRIFTRFDVASDVVENQQTTVTTGLFTGNAASLTTLFTSSLQSTSSKQYYYSVYNDTTSIAESQFAVAYGHRLGSGSSAQGTLNDSTSRAIYSQYRLLLLNPGDTTFTFANSTNSDQIYAINFDRARIKEKLNSGNWQFNLAKLANSTSVPNSAYTGSNVTVNNSGGVISLIDDSSTVTNTTLGNSGRIYNIVSGSITNGVYKQSGVPVYYGLAYPDMGILILNGNMLNASASFNSVTGSNIAGDNAMKLFMSISGSTAVDLGGSINAPQARNEQNVTSTHYFVRMKNAEYNFSNNPTFTTGSVGEFKQPTFIGDPKVYATTVGLYNDRQELLAVAKLSQPIQKSFNSEVLIKCKIDY